MTLTELLKCPKCGFMYSGNNSKVFGHFRVYVVKEYSPKTKVSFNERLLIKCKKCGSKMVITTNTDDKSVRLVMYRTKNVIQTFK